MTLTPPTGPVDHTAGDEVTRPAHRGIGLVIKELSVDSGRDVRLLIRGGGSSTGVWQRDVAAAEWLVDEERTRWWRLTEVVGFELVGFTAERKNPT